MNFTREPIIETVITPKEGHKILVRSSKATSQEEYVVDAVEVISFGHSFFFRSLERPKAFLVPISDYEVIEVKEARVTLKNAAYERTIKIGGGKEASLKIGRETEKAVEAPIVEQPAAEASSFGMDKRLDKKRDRRRHRRRRPQDERVGGEEEQGSEEPGEESTSEVQAPPAVPVFSRLIPPPPTLISEKLGKFREKTQEMTEQLQQEKIEEETSPKPPYSEPEEEGPNTEIQELQRVATSFEENSYNSSSWLGFFSKKNPFKN